MKTKWIILSLVFGLLFFGLGCMGDSVAVEGISAVTFFSELIGLLEKILPEEEGSVGYLSFLLIGIKCLE